MENTATAVKNKIEVKNLNFYYGKFHAIRNVNMSIQEKKVTAFIGPSGCGKSTLLRTFNRMFELYPGQRAEGEIVLDGENLLTTKTDISLIRAKIGMVFQKPTPFPMSIYDNIAFGVRLFERLSKGEMDERVEWALSKAALWNEVKDKLHQSGNSLSGGQQQRLCIARGVAIKPEVLLPIPEAGAVAAAGGEGVPTEFIIDVHGESYRVDITGVGVKTDGKRHFYLSLDGMPEEVVFEPLNQFVAGGSGSGKRKQASAPGDVSTTMPGNIVEVLVTEGDTVKAGQAVLITEAMKMETEVQAPIAGTVKTVHVAKGDRVNPGEVLIEIE